MNTTESNKLIAEFMGWGTKQSFVLIPYEFSNEQIRLLPKENDKYCVDISDLGFHYDWNWLIPVVDKITDLPEYQEYKDYNSSIISEGGIYINTKYIEETYNDVVEFIMWYNTPQKSELKNKKKQ